MSICVGYKVPHLCQVQGVPRLLLAGEHTHPLYWSFLHGARLSGLGQARRVAQWRRQSRDETLYFQ